MPAVTYDSRARKPSMAASRIAEQAAAHSRDVEHIVDIGLPIVRRPIDRIGDDGGDAFGDTVGGNHVEGFGVARLQQQMHVRDGLAEARPGLPAVQHQVDVRQTVQHLLTAPRMHSPPPSVRPAESQSFERRSHGARYFERGAGRAHQILERPRGAKHADAQRAAGK